MREDFGAKSDWGYKISTSLNFLAANKTSPSSSAINPSE